MFYEEIKIIGIEKDRIEKDEDFPGAFYSSIKTAYKFPFKLSQYPDSHWVDLLNQYSTINVQFNMKRKPYVFNDCLFVQIDAGEDLQKMTDDVKKVIIEVNRLFKSSCTRYAVEQERKNLYPQKDEVLERLKDKSDNVKF
jgi:hypothetical protein